MNENLKQRIMRRLETLSDQRGYQILDYVEFLESKYAERVAPTNVFARVTETVEDVLRAGKVPVKAISGTMGVMDSAGKVMRGVAAAAQAVVDEAMQAVERPASKSVPPGQSSDTGSSGAGSPEGR